MQIESLNHSMAEYLDIVDENGIPTGETVERETAHAKGFRHRTRAWRKSTCEPACRQTVNHSKKAENPSVFVDKAVSQIIIAAESAMGE